MSYELKISARERAGSRLITHVRKALLLAALDTGMSQQAIAEKLGVNRSVINRLLRGTANLTLRTVGELAWALGLEIIFIIRKRTALERRNETSASSDRINVIPEEFRLPQLKSAQVPDNTDINPQSFNIVLADVGWWII
jgi:transcriptional regulator with XRE-family HTH domain